MTLRWLASAVLAVAAALALAGAAAASSHRGASALTLTIDGRPELGGTVTAAARLADGAGRPVPNAEIAFAMPAEWGEISGEAAAGTARTDAAGVAHMPVRLRVSGDVEIVARFAGDERLEPAETTVELAVEGDRQLYEPLMPAVSTLAAAYGNWALAAVLGIVWGLYFFVARLVWRIATASDDGAPIALTPAVAAPALPGRRRALGMLVPAGMHALVAPVGLTLVGVIARSPYTHTNLEGHRPGSTYARTPYAHVPVRERMRMAMPVELPAVLARDVSFANDVLPILRRRAGPHSHVPRNSPPPQGVRLDAYEHVMAREGLVVAGKPEDSELVRVLVDDAMRMPPSLPPLPKEEVQLIVSWVAQGARDN